VLSYVAFFAFGDVFALDWVQPLEQTEHIGSFLALLEAEFLLWYPRFIALRRGEEGAWVRARESLVDKGTLRACFTTVCDSAMLRGVFGGNPQLPDFGTLDNGVNI
jgi:hypothetical protein